MKPETLATLLAGNFVCQYAFPEAYADLVEPGEAEKVDQWLQSLDRRLARLGDDGAFFVAPLQVHTNEQVAKVKTDLARFRDVYGLLVEMLNLVRLTKDGFRGVPGEYVQLAEILLKVNEDTTLVSRLRELRIPGADARLSNNELLRKMLERLRAEGYLIVSNASTETYQITGKVDHLHAVMQYLVENVPELTDTALSDAEADEDDDKDRQVDLLRAAAADGGRRGASGE
ncbi:MAG: hypothetical protein KF871_01830 [Hydrogenophaga sp.]|uniref:condensin complex protein MksE n=1 Tax=Hydrogenophaga sp. TaxID=1904254 RepID=UPI001E0066BA|nr:hypothetical protein [Hydrogenophaga sp.]MBX3608608.1 hypothetical protein [Hydrogenophaga sp.]